MRPQSDIGKLVQLSPLGEETAARLIEIHDPETTKNFSFFQEGLNLNREVAYIKKMNSSRNDCLWGIYPRNLGTVIGTVGLHDMDFEMKTVRLGIIIWTTAYNGRGYGTDSVTTALRSAFAIFEKAYLACRADNERAQKWYENLGFVREGVLRGEYLFKGERLDMVRFGMLKEDWRKAND